MAGYYRAGTLFRCCRLYDLFSGMSSSAQARPTSWLGSVLPGIVAQPPFQRTSPREYRAVFAKGTGVPQRRIDEICSGSRGMTADTALRLARFFGVEAQFWWKLFNAENWHRCYRVVRPDRNKKLNGEGLNRGPWQSR